MTVDELIGENVHHLMWRRRMSATDMCRQMSLSPASLNRKLRGEVVWKARDIEAAARVLEVDPGRLFVAGAGFEPATSGSSERVTKADVALVA